MEGLSKKKQRQLKKQEKKMEFNSMEVECELKDETDLKIAMENLLSKKQLRQIKKMELKEVEFNSMEVECELKDETDLTNAMENLLSKKQLKQIQKQKLKQKEMEFNSKEIESPLKSTQEKQLRCELNDSKASLTQTKSEGRVLQEIQEDSLQQFPDVLQEKIKGDVPQEIQLEEMELNSKEVGPPLNFYLSSLEAQARCELNDSEARLTQTKSEGRVLLDIHEDCLQNFLDVLQDRKGGDVQIYGLNTQLHEAPSRDTEFIKSQLEETNTKLQKAQSDLMQKTSIINDKDVKLEQMMKQKEALQNEVQAKKLELCAEGQRMAEALKNQKHKAKQTLESAQALHQAQMSEQRAETNRIAAALTETQDLLETERHVQPKTTTEGEMETFKNLCQATMDEQFDVNIKLKAALDKTEQDLKTVHLQWQQERFNIEARRQKDCEYFQFQVHLLTSSKAQEQEALKQTLERAQTFHQAQMDEQRVETNRIAAALKETQDLLETERLHSQQTALEEMESFKNFCQATMDEQLDVNSKLKAPLAKAELNNGQHIQLEQMKQQIEALQNELCAERQKMAEVLRNHEHETKETLKRAKIFHQAQMNKQRAETKTRIDDQSYVNCKLKAALAKAEHELKNGQHIHLEQMMEQKEALQNELSAERQRMAEALRNQEHKTEEALKRAQTLQAQMNKQRAETKTRIDDQSYVNCKLEEERTETRKILAVLEKTEDLLKTERLCFQEQLNITAQLENTCRNLDHAQLKNLATLQTLEEEATQLFERDKASQAQLEEQRVEINRIKAACKKTEDLLITERLLWQQEKCSLLQDTEKVLQSQITNNEKRKKKKWYKLF